jgi:hypothetical protein
MPPPRRDVVQTPIHLIKVVVQQRHEPEMQNAVLVAVRLRLVGIGGRVFRASHAEVFQTDP